jgi:hypothetical protein
MTSLAFREHMKGFVDFEWDDYNQALLHGRRAGRRCEFRLAMHVADVDRFVADPEHAARVLGSVTCDELGGDLEVEHGTLNLFVDQQDERHKRMRYRLLLRDPEGRPLTLSGFKVLEDDPNLDVRSDSSQLLTRLLAGHVRDLDAERHAAVVATGILSISRTGFARLLASLRTSGGSRLSRLRALGQFGLLFGRGLRVVYRGAPVVDAQSAFPGLVPGDTSLQGHEPGQWHELPERPGVVRRIVPFAAGDGTALSLHNIRAERREPHRGPVLMIVGTSVRANILYGAPRPSSLVNALVDEGYDVWIENWRASIDFPRRDYTLDQAAVFDHPAAIRRIREETGADTLKAVVHCQGSTSFMMSALAGLVPEVTTVVSNAVSLHVELTPLSKLKLLRMIPPAARVVSGIDPQWAIRAPSTVAAGIAATARVLRRDCDNPVCALSTFMYGVGPDVLWRHENLDAATHEWVGREFGYAPIAFFKGLSQSARAGHLVSSQGFDELPADFTAQPPQTTARFTFLAGSRNVCFLPAGQRKTFEYMDDRQPGRHAYRELPGYSHLDVFFGRRAHEDVFPAIVDALAR